jgi:hypothetical protein
VFIVRDLMLRSRIFKYLSPALVIDLASLPAWRGEHSRIENQFVYGPAIARIGYSKCISICQDFLPLSLSALYYFRLAPGPANFPSAAQTPEPQFIVSSPSAEQKRRF